jgi:catechol 2,3-dioxygenase-like lactoylglutathione lyase family enzyme
MGIRRLNHAVLYVGDVQASLRFYRDVLGFRVAHELSGAVFLRAEHSDNDHDLGLFAAGSEPAGSTAGRGAVGLYHLA